MSEKSLKSKKANPSRLGKNLPHPKYPKYQIYYLVTHNTPKHPQQVHMAPKGTKYPVNYPRILPSKYKSNFLTKASDEELFSVALDTCFKGCEVDEPSKLPPALQPDQILASLKQLEPLYQSDVTQPFGLETPCAKTYVTRCLVGERGTTYKYLGLRMFSSYWGDVGGGGIKDLNDWLEER